MKRQAMLSALAMLFLTPTVNAYVPNTGGGGGGGGACAKPKFSHFIPAAKAEAKSGTEFSFVASANTHPKTIKVTVKEVPVELTVPTQSESAYVVTGKLPESLKNTFARISISAESSGQCKGTEGWLIKITD